MIPLILIAALGVGVLTTLNKSNSSTSIKSFTPPKEGPIDLGENLLAFPRIDFEDVGQKLPLIVVLHGRNASEKQLEYAIPQNLPARVMFLRANLPKRVFFKPRLVDHPDVVKPAIQKAGVTLANGINKLLLIYPTSKVILLGYSQGGELAEYMATMKWNIPLWVLSFAGGLTSNLFPTKHPTEPKPVLLIWHGDQDKIVPYQMDVDTYYALKNWDMM